MSVVLITGCSAEGLGAFMAEEFASRGCRVYATARNVDKMKSLRSDIEKLELDVLIDESVQHAVKTIIDREGKIDILVNNAGASFPGPFMDLSMEALKSAFEINVFSVFRVTHAVVPYMAKRKSGLIINMGSLAGFVPLVWQGAYSTSKAALHSLTDTLDVELRPLGVRAMLLAPGVIQSNIGINAFTNATPPPADSLYTDFHEHIPDTRKYTHHPSTTPADVFARKVVNAALAPTPARYLALGHMSWFVYLLTWLPRSLRLDIFWKTNVKSISGKSA